LMTHTAASGSKVNVPRQSLSRASGTLQPPDSLGRSPSRLSVSTVATSTTNAGGGSTKSLRRQNSTINRPRPSLGPPPKPKAKDHPPTKKEKELDEGFLARMMRPTQASSSKVNEKTPTTPPRKTGPPKATPKSESKRPARIIPKIAEPNTSSPPRQGHSSKPLEEAKAESTTPQDEDAIESVAQDGTAHEEAAETSHSGEDQPDEDYAKDDAARDVAFAAEQAESAEGAVRVANDIDGEVKLIEDSSSTELAEAAEPNLQEAQTERAEVSGATEVGGDSLIAEAHTMDGSSVTPEPADQTVGGEEDPNDEIESY
jgi:hypothetical protein